jgi:hypothetical protein
MPYRAAEYLCVRLGPRALRVASNLPQSGRLQESLEAELFWKQNSVLGRDVIVLSTPIRKGDHLISTWVRIRNDSRITGKLDVIGSSTGLVPTNTLLCTLLLDRGRAESNRTGFQLVRGGPQNVRIAINAAPHRVLAIVTISPTTSAS